MSAPQWTEQCRDFNIIEHQNRLVVLAALFNCLFTQINNLFLYLWIFNLVKVFSKNSYLYRQTLSSLWIERGINQVIGSLRTVDLIIYWQGGAPCSVYIYISNIFLNLILRIWSPDIKLENRRWVKYRNKIQFWILAGCSWFLAWPDLVILCSLTLGSSWLF